LSTMNDHNDANTIMAPAPTAPTHKLRIPTMDECVCFLEKNQTVMQIIGFLMDAQEQNHQERIIPLDLETIVKGTYNATYDESKDDDDDDDAMSVDSEGDSPTVLRYYRLMEDHNYCGDHIRQEYSWSNEELPIEAPSIILPLSELAFKAISAQFKKDGTLNDHQGKESLVD
jgi:hypothetical protein